MPAFLIPIIAWFSHNVARFIGVVAIGLIIVGTPMMIYHNITKTAYNNGYKAGYSQAIKDHPTVNGNGNTINLGKQLPLIYLKIWKLELGI